MQNFCRYENANFDFSVPVLVGVGKAIYPTIWFGNQNFWFEDNSVFESYDFAEFLRSSQQHTFWGNVTDYFFLFKSVGMRMR